MAKKNIFLSIIIPSFNTQATIDKTLSSVFSNSFKKAFEVIVVDDASTDNTLKIIRKYNVRVLKNKINSGPAYSRNVGAQKSRGRLLLFLDSDVVLRRNTIRNLVSHYEKVKRGGKECVCGCYFEKKPVNKGFGPELNALHYYYLLEKNIALYSSSGILSDNVFPSFCGLISKKVFFNLGGFNEKYKIAGGEEHDLGFRLQIKQIPIYILLNSPVSHHFRPLLKMIKVHFKRGINYLITEKKYPQKKICYGVNATEAFNFFLPFLTVFSLISSIIWRPLFLLAFLLLLFHLFFYREFYAKYVLTNKGLFFLIKTIPAMQLIYFSKFCAVAFALFLIYIIRRQEILF